MANREEGLPIEEFIQALTSQLDRAQSAMALKARFGMPLTFAVKDLTLDLKVHVQMSESHVRIRPAGPDEPGASEMHLTLTTITKPMIEENTFEVEPGEPSLKEILGDDVSEAERRRLEWAGIHNASQLRRLERDHGEQMIEQVAQVPASRLRAAMRRASRPRIHRISSDPGLKLRIQGRNLVRDGAPQVTINKRPAPVLKANRRELVVARSAQQMSGDVVVVTGPGNRTETGFDVGPEILEAESAMGAGPLQSDPSDDGGER